MDVVADGFSSLVSNVIGGESKNNKIPSNRVSYKGHQLLRIQPITETQVDELREMRDSEPEEIRFWTEPLGNKYVNNIIIKIVNCI